MKELTDLNEQESTFIEALFANGGNIVKAAAKIVNSMDAEMPNPIHLQAANSLLDRVGIIKRDFAEENRNVIKANIFILPEKRTQEIVDTVYTAITDK